MLTRRDFLGTACLVAGAAMLPMGACAFPAAPSGTIALPPGLQLWTVKDELAKDFAGTLQKLKAIGYARIEAAGWLGKTPAEYAAGVTAAGLEVYSCHFGMRDLWTDADSQARLAEAKASGAKYVVASSPQVTAAMPQGLSWAKGMGKIMTLAGWQANAERMNKVGAQAKAMGLTFGYHNHSAEFLEYDGKLAFAELLRITDPELVTFEIDIGWVAAAGVDPVAALRMAGKRTHLLHIKDLATKERTPNKIVEDESTVPIGSGSVDWKAVFAAADDAAIHSWFVEQEEPFTQPPLDALAQSFAYLQTLKAA